MVREFIEKLLAPDFRKQNSALSMLDELDKLSREEFLGRVLESASIHELGRVCRRLGEHKRVEAIRPITAVLVSHPVAGIRTQCVMGLRDMDDAGVLEGLVKALEDEAEWVLIAACTAIADLVCSKIVNPLSKLLDHPSWNVRLYASATLIDLKIRDGRMLDTVRSLAVSDEAAEHDKQVRQGHQAYKEVGESIPDSGPYRQMADIVKDAERLFSADQ